MPYLRIRLFGGLEVRREGDLLSGFPTEKSKCLFAFLVLHRDRFFSRDVLCGRLWGGQPESDARKALRTALWRIRSTLEPEEGDRGRAIRADGNRVGFPGRAPVWVDAWEFEERTEGRNEGVAEELDADGARLHAEAASLYRGDLLEGIYRDWCTFHRERFRTAYLTCLERLLSYCRRHADWLEAITWGRRLLRLDPLREHVHRALMECHYAMGDRPSALRRYERCEEVLSRELGIDPMPETRELRKRILDAGDAGDGGRPSARSAEPASPSPSEAKDEPLRKMAREVDDALEELYGLTDRLERARRALRGGAGDEGRGADAIGPGPGSIGH